MYLSWNLTARDYIYFFRTHMILTIDIKKSMAQSRFNGSTNGSFSLAAVFPLGILR